MLQILEIENINQRDPDFSIQLGTRDSTPPTLHIHNYIEITYILEGSGFEVINGEIHKISAGSIMINMPYYVHDIYAENENSTLVFYICHISLDVLYKEDYMFQNLKKLILENAQKPNNYMNLSESQREDFDILFFKIYNEYFGNDSFSDFKCYLHLTELLILFNRLHPHQNTDFKMDISSKKISDFLYIINKNYKYSDFTLKKMEEIFNFNGQYISQMLKKHTGKTFVNLLNEYRLKEASYIIKSTKTPIKQVALYVGFDSYLNFFRAFKKYYHISPQKLRQSGKKLVG